MAYAEIDSFVLKYKNLLYSGMNADLMIKTEAGKTLITLTAEVKVSPTSRRHVPTGGGARERRRVRQAAARAAAAVGPGDSVVADSEKEATAKAGKASEDSTKHLKTNEKVTAAEDAAPTTVKLVDPVDEIENDTISSETEEELCQAISIIPVKKLDLSDEEIEKILRQKLLAKKLKVLDCGVHRSSNGIFIRCDVAIEPVKKKFFEAINFEFGHCQAVPIYGRL